MARKAYARRYARAIFEIALEKAEQDRWRSDLDEIASVVGDAEVKNFLENPWYHFADKARLLSERMTGLSPLALNVLYLLMEKGELDIIGEIIAEYQHLLNEHRGMEQADVKAAVPLDAEDETKLAASLGKVVGKKVTVTSSVDPSLIGGIRVSIGGKLLDGSTRSRLEALKKELIGMERRH